MLKLTWLSRAPTIRLEILKTHVVKPRAPNRRAHKCFNPPGARGARTQGQTLGLETLGLETWVRLDSITIQIID